MIFIMSMLTNIPVYPLNIFYLANLATYSNFVSCVMHLLRILDDFQKKGKRLNAAEEICK